MLGNVGNVDVTDLEKKNVFSHHSNPGVIIAVLVWKELSHILGKSMEQGGREQNMCIFSPCIAFYHFFSVLCYVAFWTMFSSPPSPLPPPSQMAYILQVHWYIGYPLKAIGAKAERDLLTCLKCACVMAFVIVLSFEKYHVLYYVCTIYSSSTLSCVASIVVQLHYEE